MSNILRNSHTISLNSNIRTATHFCGLPVPTLSLMAMAASCISSPDEFIKYSAYTRQVQHMASTRMIIAQA